MTIDEKIARADERARIIARLRDLAAEARRRSHDEASTEARAVWASRWSGYQIAIDEIEAMP